MIDFSAKFLKKNEVRFILLIFPFVLCGCRNLQKSSLSFQAMNTFVSVQTFGENSKNVNQKIKARLSELESLFSTTDSSSEIYKFNHSSEKIQVSSETYSLLSYSVKMAEIFNGHFNPALFPVIREWGFTTGNYHVPSQEKINFLLKKTDFSQIQFFDDNFVQLQDSMSVDFGSVAKGFASDEIVKILSENNILSALIDFGGNIIAFGEKPDSSFWRIGIKNPFGGEVSLAVKVKNQMVITSGGYERFFTDENQKKYIHIFDGKTGFPVENEIESVTIICENGLYADTLSTALFIIGSENAVSFWKERKDFQMIILQKDGSILYTSPLESQIEILSEFSEICVID